MVIKDYVTVKKLEETEDSINVEIGKVGVVAKEKARVFKTTPYPPYSIGDVYINGSNVYTCISPKELGDNYSPNDWELNLDGDNYTSKSQFKIETDEIKASVSKVANNMVLLSKLSGNPIVIEDAGDYELNSIQFDGMLEQNGTPTPSSPVEIKTIKGTQISGKDGYWLEQITTNKDNISNTALINMTKPQLFNINTIIRGKYISDKGVITDNSTTFYSDFIEVKPNTKYTINGKTTWTVTALYDENKQFISRVNDNALLTTSNTRYIATNGTIGNLNNINIYEGVSPYYEFSEVDDIRDTYTNGILKKRNDKIILNGTENWVEATTTNSSHPRFRLTNFVNKNIVIPSSNAIAGKLKSNYFNAVPNSGGTGTYNCVQGISIDTTYNLGVYVNDITNVNDFKTWLSNNPLEIHYVLKEEGTYQLEHEKLKLFNGYNRITLNIDLLPTLNIEYLTYSQLNDQFATKTELDIQGDSISSVVKQIGDRSTKTTTLAQDISSLEAAVSDVADITTSSSSDKAFISDTELTNIESSYPIRIEIRPIGESISYLYPNSNLFPSNDLFSKQRTLKFTNTQTNNVYNYVLPDDLLYYNANIYDTFIADYEENKCYVRKRCKYNSDGTIGLLGDTEIKEYPFEEIKEKLDLEEGNYKVELLGYTNGFIFVRLMTINTYTKLYATKVEVSNGIKANAKEVTEYVNAQITNVDGNIKKVSGELSLKLGKNENKELISMLNASADEITLDGGSKILLNSPGKLIIKSGNFTLDKDGTVKASNGEFKGVVKADSGYFNGTVNATGGKFKGRVEADEGYFNGTVNATAGTFKGRVEADNGYFNGYINATDGVFNGTVNATNGVFNGKVYASDGEFNGKVYATDGIFNGKVYATDGVFNGTLSANCLMVVQ